MLFFDQTLEFTSDIEVDELPPAAIAAVRDGQRFDDRQAAERYLEHLRESSSPSGP